MMLGYLLERELEKYWKEVATTVREGIDELSALNYDNVKLMRVLFGKLPRHRKLGEKLL